MGCVWFIHSLWERYVRTVIDSTPLRCASTPNLLWRSRQSLADRLNSRSLIDHTACVWAHQEREHDKCGLKSKASRNTSRPNWEPVSFRVRLIQWTTTAAWEKPQGHARVYSGGIPPGSYSCCYIFGPAVELPEKEAWASDNCEAISVTGRSRLNVLSKWDWAFE